VEFISVFTLHLDFSHHSILGQRGKILKAENSNYRNWRNAIELQPKQKLANSYGFDFYVLGCNATKDILNGTEYYNQEMVDYLESKFWYWLVDENSNPTGQH
jgi:hypothetical protein